MSALMVHLNLCLYLRAALVARSPEIGQTLASVPNGALELLPIDVCLV